MTKIAIVSLHFSPGYIAHMQAWYKLCEQCGYSVRLYVDRQYREYFAGTEYRLYTEIKDLGEYRPDCAIVQNIGTENIRFFKWCGENGCGILYILHEPYMGFRELMKDGAYFHKQLAACLLNAWLCRKADKVIVCSGYAEDNCRKYMKNVRGKCVRFPLLFPDAFCRDEEETAGETEREYFSLIGTYASSKGSDLFLQFMRDAVLSGEDIRFQIATRSDLTKQLSDSVFQKMIRDGQLVVRQGRSLTADEINEAYRRSICCWNGYRRTTQSGVLPNAYMMGTPVVATPVGSFAEFVEAGKTGEFIDNRDAGSIREGYRKIRERSREYSRNCRQFFLEHFYYGNQAEALKRIIEREVLKGKR